MPRFRHINGQFTPDEKDRLDELKPDDSTWEEAIIDAFEKAYAED